MSSRESRSGVADPALQVRRQAQLKRRRRRLGVLSLVVLLALVAGWLLLFSPVLRASEVRVQGTALVGEDEVRQAAQVALGTPMARIDAQTIEQRVEALPEVASCNVTRTWPHTITLEITERTLVYQAQDDTGFHWTDATGVVFHVTTETQKVPTAHLPANADQQLRADIATMLNSLSSDVRSRVQSISAGSRDNILVQLDNDQAVFWGSADQSAEKAALLPVLLARGGSTFDISSVSHPAVK